MPGRPTAMRLALLSFGLALVLYALAVGTDGGRTLDGAGLLSREGTTALPQVRDTTDRLVRTIDRGSLAIGGGAVLAVAVLRRRLRLGATVAVLVVGANTSTQLLKPILGQVDPFGGDVLREFGGTFPSGHATVAMSLSLALVIVMPPLTRSAVALLGGAYAAAVGVGLVALGWQYPSDVAGGYLIAAGWASFAVALCQPGVERGETGAYAMDPRTVVAIVVGVAAALGTLLVVTSVSTQPELLTYGRLRTTFFVSSAALGAMAVAIPTVAAATVRSPRPP